MPVHIVRLGTPRKAGEGVRLGTVRRPPRGVPKERFADDDWYDVWLPTLAPTAELMREGRASETASQWRSFARRFRAQMSDPEAKHVLDVLAALSHSASFSVGCYCEDESRCHRSLLRELLVQRGADVAD